MPGQQPAGHGSKYPECSDVSRRDRGGGVAAQAQPQPGRVAAGAPTVALTSPRCEALRESLNLKWQQGIRWTTWCSDYHEPIAIGSNAAALTAIRRWLPQLPRNVVRCGLGTEHKSSPGQLRRRDADKPQLVRRDPRVEPGTLSLGDVLGAVEHLGSRRGRCTLQPSATL